MKTPPEKKEPETFYPASRKHWRNWLQKNHKAKQSIWVICYKQSANMPTITWSDAVDEALCFGWIDSTRRPIDHEKFMQFFGKRKPTSTWSRINKEKIERLIAGKLMTKAGLEVINAAKANGSWTILDEVEELIVPADLEKEFKGKKEAKNYFTALSRSNKRMLLQWLVLAKQQETRKKRIAEIVACSAQSQMPKQFQLVRAKSKG